MKRLISVIMIMGILIGFGACDATDSGETSVQKVDTPDLDDDTEDVTSVPTPPPGFDPSGPTEPVEPVDPEEPVEPEVNVFDAPSDIEVIVTTDSAVSVSWIDNTDPVEDGVARFAVYLSEDNGASWVVMAYETSTSAEIPTDRDSSPKIKVAAYKIVDSEYVYSDYSETLVVTPIGAIVYEQLGYDHLYGATSASEAQSYQYIYSMSDVVIFKGQGTQQRVILGETKQWYGWKFDPEATSVWITSSIDKTFAEWQAYYGFTELELHVYGIFAE